MALQANRPLPDSYRLGDLTVEKILSSGGFSFVYLVRDAAWTPYVVKEYLPAGIAVRSSGDQVGVLEGRQALFARGLRSFIDEAAAIARIDHPNVVRVKDFFRANGTAYMVMHHMPGRSLQFHIHSKKEVLDERFLRPFFLRLLNGLREVHVRRLLHLDIKPANILVGAQEQPLLLDFGAVRSALRPPGATAKAMLTEGFAAPEQHRQDATLGPWTDVYAVGATLFSCLAGQPPAPARARLQDDRQESARSLLQGRFSHELLAIVDWCLMLDPLARPQSVYALQRALQDGSGIPAHLLQPPAPPVHPLRRLTRPLRLLFGGGAAEAQRLAGLAPAAPAPLSLLETPDHAIKPPRRP